MADQAINALSTKTAPETSDQLLLVGTGEPQLIDYDKLADAILNKITSKNYALDAGQMTLLAALNKLNSDKLGGYTLLFSGIMSTEQSIKTLSDNISNYKFVYILAFSAGEDNVRGSSLVLKDIFKKKGSITVCWFSGSPTAIAVYYNDDTHVSVKTENGAVNTLHLYGMK